MKNEAYKKAEEKIAAALREGATELDLSVKEYWKAEDSEKLTELPESLWQLTQLQSLDLRGNQLSALPESLGQLTQLQSLDLSSNQLSALPESLGQLTQLQSLNVSNNQLSALPESLGQLTRLKKFIITMNKLKFLPPEIGSLKNLEILKIDRNRITMLPPEIKYLTRLNLLTLGWYAWSRDMRKLPKEFEMLSNLEQLEARYIGLIELPQEIGQLSRLMSIHLNGNDLTDLPPSLAQLEHLKELDLGSNPLNPELAAAYAQGLEAVKDYLRAKAEQQIILDEAKLILIGEGGVGKTSLLGALRGADWVEDRKTTHGVEVDIQSFQLADAASGKTITFNGWDFGGQAIYRHTHQLFFTAPAVYLAVWEPRRGPEQCAVAEWVKMVKQRAYDDSRPDEHPRILVVATHGGPTERLAHIDEQSLRDEFGFLVCGFHHVDSYTGEGLDALKEAIAREAEAIPSVGRSVPKSWKDLLDALRARSESEAYISYAQYAALCETLNISQELAATYAAILNELGHIIHYRNHADLQDTVILKAEWLSKAMSFVLEDKGVKDNNGLVQHRRLFDIWRDPAREPRDRYPDAVHPVFLKLMERFDLSYRVALQDANAPDTSLIAQLVPGARPPDWEQHWQIEPGDSERTQVCRVVDSETGRTAQVEGLVYRLIVRLHRYSLGKQDYCQSRHWKTGLLLDDGFNGRAFIEEIGGDVRVTVRAAYPERFLAVLCDDVRWLVESFWKGLDCRLSVPCGLGDCKGLIEMQEMHDNLKEEIEKVRCPVCRKWHNIHEKLGATAPRPAFSAALAELKQGQAEIKHGLESGFSSVRTDLRRLISQADEQFAALMNALIDPAKDGPRLFSFEPVEKTGFFDKPKWVAREFRLVLWCEHSRLPLPVVSGDATRGVYELELTRDWIKKAAPFLKILSGTLSLALPMAAATLKFEMEESAYQAIEKQLDFGKQAAETWLESSEKTGEWLADGDRTDLESGRQPISADGAVLRELHALLKQKDPAKQFGGLVRVQNKKREFLWVHEQYADEY